MKAYVVQCCTDCPDSAESSGRGEVRERGPSEMLWTHPLKPLVNAFEVTMAASGAPPVCVCVITIIVDLSHSVTTVTFN